MDSTRQNKVSRLLQKELGEFFQRESGNLFNRAFITVTTVRISADLSVAKVYLSILIEKDREPTLKLIKSQSKEIRKRIGDRIKQQVRIIPNFEFFIDDSLDYAMKIESLLKK
ncbi:MAG: 30S ribosome-binding factor RbfA [Bacteroidetes bacterium]|nr:30S ribosome-binding factor RbfA [Bacteroidota bacterium]MBK9673610.1 30S ribosome-binding factor RbfA [Bacteroidota bacterium]MBK9799089.1 30S ribosome-binding factor RbfA [Bacteroidota bacterium]MBP6413866.1 30S ribosome-binding factor RbfA [Bacteroidia bacterium]